MVLHLDSSRGKQAAPPHIMAATKIAMSGRAQSSRTKFGGIPLDPYVSLIRNAVPVSVPTLTPPRRLLDFTILGSQRTPRVSARSIQIGL
jgi:hypothetical protein